MSSSTSRAMPPAVAAANDSTSTPNRSSRWRTATSPPLLAKAKGPRDASRAATVAVMAKAKVPRKSIRATKVAVMARGGQGTSRHRFGFAHAGDLGRQRDELGIVQVGQLHPSRGPVRARLLDPLLRGRHEVPVDVAR